MLRIGEETRCSASPEWNGVAASGAALSVTLGSVIKRWQTHWQESLWPPSATGLAVACLFNKAQNKASQFSSEPPCRHSASPQKNMLTSCRVNRSAAKK